ncbi:MAG: hypothetical protein ACYCYO_08190 [Bacilli bacterium]
MRFDRVSLSMTQQDVENAVNELLPSNFRVGDLHLTAGGAVATLATPWLRLNVLLRVAPQQQPGTEHGSPHGDDEISPETLVKDGIALIEVRASRWLPLPRLLLANLLARFLGDVSPAVHVKGASVKVDIKGLLEPLLKVQGVDMILADGLLRLEGTGVTLDATPVDHGHSLDGIA